MKSLYILDGAAPLVTLVFYISEFLFIQWDKYPDSIEGWYLLFQQSKVVGLFYLNALDILSIALLGVMFLALYAALKPVNGSLMKIAVYFGLLGVGEFIVPWVAMLSIMKLSEQYALAHTAEVGIRLLAAGETLGALGTATPQTAGFFFLAIGVFTLSLVMLRGNQFNKITETAPKPPELAGVKPPASLSYWRRPARAAVGN